MSNKYNLRVFFGGGVPMEQLVMTHNEVNYFVRDYERAKANMMSEMFLYTDPNFGTVHGFDLINVVKFLVEPKYDELDEYYDANVKGGEPKWN